MPLSQTVITQAIMNTIITKIIEKALFNPGSFGIGMNVSESIQSSFFIRGCLKSSFGDLKTVFST